jgi:large subunit ribosomal protein L21
LVQSLAVPKPDSSASAVVVSGGKQFRVAPGDRILVDRLAAEPGSSVKLGRVLLFSDGEKINVGNPLLDGVDVDARVIDHRRGPRIETIRYKSKKRVRVHAGGRAYLTALEIIAVGGVGLPQKEEEQEEASKPARKTRSRVKAAPKKKTKKVEAEEPVETVAQLESEAEPKAEKPAAEVKEEPKKTPRRRSAKKDGK